jgi:hypothetical protein
VRRYRRWRATYDRAVITRTVVVGTTNLVGKTVAGSADGHEIARGTLALAAGRATATLCGPAPLTGKAWKTLQATVDGRVVDTIALPDYAPLRARHPATGIPAAVVGEQTNAVQEFAGDAVAGFYARSPASADFLAWLCETTPGAHGAAHGRLEPARAVDT